MQNATTAIPTCVPITADDGNDLCSWSESPSFRGTLDILWLCVSTLGLCVWNAVHPDVPHPGTSKWRVVGKRVWWLLIGLFTPEMLVLSALAQFRQAYTLLVRVSQETRVPTEFPWWMRIIEWVWPTPPMAQEMPPIRRAPSLRASVLAMLPQSLNLELDEMTAMLPTYASEALLVISPPLPGTAETQGVEDGATKPTDQEIAPRSRARSLRPRELAVPPSSLNLELEETTATLPTTASEVSLVVSPPLPEAAEMQGLENGANMLPAREIVPIRRAPSLCAHELAMLPSSPDLELDEMTAILPTDASETSLVVSPPLPGTAEMQHEGAEDGATKPPDREIAPRSRAPSLRARELAVLPSSLNLELEETTITLPTDTSEVPLVVSPPSPGSAEMQGVEDGVTDPMAQEIVPIRHAPSLPACELAMLPSPLNLELDEMIATDTSEVSLIVSPPSPGSAEMQEVQDESIKPAAQQIVPIRRALSLRARERAMLPPPLNLELDKMIATLRLPTDASEVSLAVSPPSPGQGVEDGVTEPTAEEIVPIRHAPSLPARELAMLPSSLNLELDEMITTLPTDASETSPVRVVSPPLPGTADMEGVGNGAQESKRKHPWTLTHSFYAVMHGFLAADGDAFWTISDSENPHGYLESIYDANKGIRCIGAASDDALSIPDISADDLDDRSKADSLAKVLLVWQFSVFIANCAARKNQNLPLSLLEITTLAHSLCALIALGLWWYKPHSVGEATVIGCTRTLPQEQKITLVVTAGSAVLPGNDIIDIPRTITILGVAVLYGLPHLLGLSVHFPTSAEQRCWRIATLAVICSPLVICVIFWTGRLSKKLAAGNSLTILSALLIGLYALSSMFLVTESVHQIFALPKASFHEPQLTRYLPNFS